MPKSKPISSRLNRALALFVSVPMAALPAAAQQAPTQPTIRTRLGVRAIRGERVRVPNSDEKTVNIGFRTIGIRVPDRVAERVPGVRTK